MKDRFKIGDRVISTDGYMHLPAGEVGTVIEIIDAVYAVEFDDWTEGHDCQGATQHGHGFYVPHKKLAHYEDSGAEQPIAPPPVPDWFSDPISAAPDRKAAGL